MAENSNPNYTSKLILLCLFGISLVSVQCNDNPRELRLVYYIQETLPGPNGSSIAVAGIAGLEWNFNQFATILVTDNNLTRGPSINSPSVGRVEGILAVSSQDGSKLYDSLAVIFTNAEYQGSTIELQGISVQDQPFSEVAVVGGTGKFRFVSGYATIESANVSTSNPVVAVRLTLNLRYPSS